MPTFVNRLSDDRGQDVAEYGIALSVIGALAIAAALAIGSQVGAIWDPVDATLADTADGNDGHHHVVNGAAGTAIDRLVIRQDPGKEQVAIDVPDQARRRRTRP